MNKDIPSGARVLLSPSFDDCHHTPFNPLSTFGIMQGENPEEHGWFVVKWDNGQSNQYQADHDELIHIPPSFDVAKLMDLFTRFVWDEFQVSLSNEQIDGLVKQV